jgi:hypothetical protein
MTMTTQELQDASFQAKVEGLRMDLDALGNNPASRAIVQDQITRLYADRFGTAVRVTGGGANFNPATGEITMTVTGRASA